MSLNTLQVFEEKFALGPQGSEAEKNSASSHAPLLPNARDKRDKNFHLTP